MPAPPGRISVKKLSHSLSLIIVTKAGRIGERARSTVVKRRMRKEMGSRKGVVIVNWRLKTSVRLATVDYDQLIPVDFRQYIYHMYEPSTKTTGT